MRKGGVVQLLYLATVYIVTIDAKIYVMYGENGSTIFTFSSVKVFQMSISPLYPVDDNYVAVECTYQSPKLLENLCIDHNCRSLPDLDGELPPGRPQYIINFIVQFLVSHGALNESTLKALRD